MEGTVPLAPGVTVEFAVLFPTTPVLPGAVPVPESGINVAGCVLPGGSELSPVAGGAVPGFLDSAIAWSTAEHMFSKVIN